MANEVSCTDTYHIYLHLYWLQVSLKCTYKIQNIHFIPVFAVLAPELHFPTTAPNQSGK